MPEAPLTMTRAAIIVGSAAGIAIMVFAGFGVYELSGGKERRDCFPEATTQSVNVSQRRAEALFDKELRTDKNARLLVEKRRAEGNVLFVTVTPTERTTGFRRISASYPVSRASIVGGIWSGAYAAAYGLDPFANCNFVVYLDEDGTELKRTKHYLAYGAF